MTEISSEWPYLFLSANAVEMATIKLEALKLFFAARLSLISLNLICSLAIALWKYISICVANLACM